MWKNFGVIKESVPVTGITLNQTSATLTMVGATLQLTATVSPANASYQNVIWTSSDPIRATVNATGLVTAMATGTYVITATEQQSGYSASCTVTVQYGDGTFTNIDAYIWTNYSEKTINEVQSNGDYNDNITQCLDFSNGPFDIYFSCQSNTNVKKTLKISLYVPKRTFTESFLIYCDFSYLNYQEQTYYTPTLNDLEKIKEYYIETNMTRDDYTNNYSGGENILWDGMTDPAFTGGKSYPVQDNVFIVVTDAQTGAILSNPPWGRHISRYQSNCVYSYTAKENSVVCDIYFTSQLPIKRAVPFFGYSCTWDWADWTQLRKGGIEKMVLSLLHKGAIINPTSSVSGHYYWEDDNVVAYQVFDNLSPAKNGVYHISWEMKDLQGNFLDVRKMNYGVTNGFDHFGLYIEGDGQETVNLGIPGYAAVGGYKSTTVPPRQLNPEAIITYPEFEIENGALLHYHGKGGNVVIPNSVSKINDFALYKYDGNRFKDYQQVNIQKITLPSGLTSIGDYAFHGQSGLTSVTIPSFVTSIGDFTFSGCTGLSSVTISGLVTSIGDYAFWGCNNLTSVTCYATPPPAATLAFAFVNLSICTLYVPQGTKALYQAATGWKDFGTITELGAPPTGVAVNQSSVSIAAGSALQLIATVAPSTATVKDVSWSSSNNKIATVSADGTVTGIAPGTATITVITQYGNKTATCIVTVIDLNYTGFTINKGDRVALFQTVDLDFSFNGGSPTHFMASENSNFNGSVWQEFNPAALKYTFASSDPGSKTVYAKLKNGTGETEAKSGNILYKPVHSITQVNMYPSPVENTLNVELTSEFTNFKVEVYTSTGGLLLSQQFNNPVFKLDISSCPSGILIVRISDNKTKTTVERSIIKH